MNVLVTTSTFPRWPGDELSDFVWKQVRQLSLQYPDLHLSVLAPHHQGAKFFERWGRVEIIRVPYFYPCSMQKLVYPVIWSNLQHRPYLIFQVPLLFLSLFFATIYFIYRKKIDLVYSHWFLPQGIACGLAAVLMGVPHCISAHEAFCFRLASRIPIVGKRLLQYFLGRSEAISVAGSASIERTKALIDPADWPAIERKIRSIPMGVSEEFFRDVHASTRASSDPYVLFVGRFEEKKGVEVLLEAFASIASRHRKLQLVLAGSGDLQKRYKEYAELLGIAARVHFRGFVQGEHKSQLFAGADMLVVPSVVAADGNTEGLPVVLLEGLVAGLPCVATDVSGADDVIENGSNGFLIPQRSPIALAAKMTQILQLSAAQREALCGQARKTGEQYLWENMAAEHFEHLIACSWRSSSQSSEPSAGSAAAAMSTV